MLALTLKVGSKALLLGSDGRPIGEIHLVEVHRTKAKLGFTFNTDVKVVREALMAELRIPADLFANPTDQNVAAARAALESWKHNDHP